MKAQVYSLQLIHDRSVAFAVREVSGGEAAAKVLASVLAGSDVERFAVLSVDAKNRPIGVHLVAIGQLSRCQIAPRDVFKAAILCNASGIILGHNHPSGDSSPSDEDKVITGKLVALGKELGIPVVDHIILGSGEPFSFFAKGMV